MMKSSHSTLTRLLSATALGLISSTAFAQDLCGQGGPVLPAGCEPAGAGDALSIPVGVNSEPDMAPATGGAGFVISVNGAPIAGDARVADTVRQTDLALANADVQVTFDGLGADPRLDLEIIGPGRIFAPGDTVSLQSALNYPAYVTRGELRVIDLDARGGPRTMLVAPIAPNGQATVTLPQGDNLVIVHRVYDATGRYDETAPLVLGRADVRALADGVEEGSDNTGRRRIPVYGGAVTVSGSNVAPGASVLALGETIRPDPSGGFVIQRILPAGDYGVDVQIQGAGQNLSETRDITIPASEWFYVATADLTFGTQSGDGPGTYTTGRLAFYVDGKTETGLNITASADTGEGDIDQIFRQFDEKDPRNLLLRIDPDDLYPTYGDDSTAVDNTPTSGKFYFRIERAGNFVQWGDFRANVAGGEYVRNERTLYGLQAQYATAGQTSTGEARAQIMLYAAQPDMLPQRDTFRGTGGSVYFLDKQDIASATETITVQVRDPDSGRILQTRSLTAGRDYQINYVQGIVTLSQPLQSSAGGGIVTNGALGDAEVVLVVQYEYTPTSGDIDGFATGGRVEGWITDQVRVGLSGIVEQTGTADQTAVGVDLLYQFSEATYASIEAARTQGPGFGTTFSADGGLIIDTVSPTAGDGTAIKAQVRVGLADLGLDSDGAIGAYVEQRSQGFSTLDRQVTATTGDEDLWGVYVDAAATDRLRFSANYDSYENAAGDVDHTGRAEAEYDISAALTLGLGVELQDKDTGTENGTRTDLAVRLTYGFSDTASVYVFGQNSVAVNGLPRNDRVGLGGTYAFANGWTVAGELSDGSLGTGGKLQFNREDAGGNTSYFGYELEPARELSGVTLRGTDAGRFVVGGTNQVSSTVAVFGENTYDMFGQHHALTSAYGLTYTPNDYLSYTTALEIGTIQDNFENDFDRRAVSFGVKYQDQALTASGRIEYRTEDGLLSGEQVSANTLLIAANAAYKIDEVQRLLFSADLAQSQTDESAILNGDYADIVLGYAYRPVEDDRLNILARYRYLYDMFGQRVDDVDENGPRQRSHVISIDASYDISRTWTIGGKIGYRVSETSANDTADFVQNDAWLVVANARMHLVHDWDILIEARELGTVQAQGRDFGVLAAVYKQLGNHLEVGVGYNFGQISDDLTDLTDDSQGAFINLVAKF